MRAPQYSVITETHLFPAFLVTNQNNSFHEYGLKFRNVMPECIFVLLGPWNRYRCFLKDERNGMGALHIRLQNLQRIHNSLTFPQ